MTRKDVIIIASVSCIYGLGSVEDYDSMAVSLTVGESHKRDTLLHKLTDIQYPRSDIDFKRGSFRVKGDIVDVHPSYSDTCFRLEFFGDELEKISECDAFTGEVLGTQNELKIYPAKHTVTDKDRMAEVIKHIQDELEERVKYFQEIGKAVEAQRIRQRTEYDIEMIQETGYCSGIENYTRYLGGRGAGEPPATLLEYFPDDFLLMVDESHISIPQVGAMWGGNKSRKDNLIQYGFRLPSAYDNRPLTFEEFENKVEQAVYVSATPAKYEIAQTDKKDIVEQIIRPTGLLDPVVEVRPTENQMDDLLNEIKVRVNKKERALVTTLTKRMAEELTDFLQEAGMKVRYLHSDIDTIERIEILRDLRLGVIDIIVGINLLREGLDLPEVTLVAILDADKEGFLRSRDALVQTIGRAARNSEGRVIMYADKMTNAMNLALEETTRRRKIQMEYNEKNGITPQTIMKAVRDLEFSKKDDKKGVSDTDKLTREQLRERILELEEKMDVAVGTMDFEKAADLRDQIEELERKITKRKK